MEVEPTLRSLSEGEGGPCWEAATDEAFAGGGGANTVGAAKRALAVGAALEGADWNRLEAVPVCKEEPDRLFAKNLKEQKNQGFGKMRSRNDANVASI